jgi:hypothetical protein
VQWFRRLVAFLSLRRPGFSPRSIHVVFVVVKVALGQALLRVLRFSPVSIFLPVLSAHSFTYKWCYIISEIENVVKYRTSNHQRKSSRITLCWDGVEPQVIRLNCQEMAGKVYSQCYCKVRCISAGEFKYSGWNFFWWWCVNNEKCTVPYRLSCLCFMWLEGVSENWVYLFMYVYI